MNMAGITDDDLARRLGDLAVALHDQSDTDAMLRAITYGAVAIVGGARWAGISLIHGRTVEARVPTDPLVATLDGLQSQLGEGPCISAIRDHRIVHVPDMAGPTRWPRFAAAAAELGVACSLSFQLFVRQADRGALNLYGGEPGVFSEDSFEQGEILAQHASVAMAGAQSTAQMHQAVASRDLIGQAKGVLMERFDIDDVQAFALLTRISQESNRKLVHVAARVINTRGQH